MKNNTPYVKFGFLFGLLRFETPVSSAPSVAQVFQFCLFTVFATCILAGAMVAGLILLKLSMANLAWLLPISGKQLITALWRWFGK